MLKAKIRALTLRTSQQDLKSTLIRLNQIMRGWVNYFRHAAGKRTLNGLSHLVWWRGHRVAAQVAPLEVEDVRAWFTTPDGRWRPLSADGILLFNLAAVPVTRYQ